MSKFCTRCGAEIAENNAFCTKCGATQNAAFDQVHEPEITNRFKPEKKKSPVRTNLIVVILSICLFITSALAVTIYEARQLSSAEKAEKLLDNIQVLDLFENLSESNRVDLDRFYSYLNEDFGIDITDKKLNNFVNNSTVKHFVANKLSKFIEYLFEGDANLTITKQEVIVLLQENSDAIYTEFGKKLVSDNLEDLTNSHFDIEDLLNIRNDFLDIADWIFDDADYIEIINSDDIENDFSALYYLIHIGFSYYIMAFFVLLSAVIIFFMIRKGLTKALYSIGIVSTVFSVSTGIIALISSWIPSLWNAICGGSIAGIIIGDILFANIVLNEILFVLGIVLLIVRKLIVKYRAEKQSFN